MADTKNPAGGPGDGVKLSQGKSIMRQIPDSVKTIPLSGTHLSAAAVLACSIIDHQEANGELHEELLMLRQIVSDLRELMRWMLYEASDLLTRQDAALQMVVAAREHSRFRAPAWFFEFENTDLRAMLTRRAKYLLAAKLDVDPAWDLLTEFTEANHHPVDQAMLSEIVTAVYRKEGHGCQHRPN